MFEHDDRLAVATRLSHGEPISSVFSDMRESFLSGKISAHRFIADCNTALMLFHVDYEINLKGIEKCQSLAQECLNELTKHIDLFETSDIQNVAPYPQSDETIKNFSNFVAESFARTFGSHFEVLKTESEKKTAIKFTLGMLLSHQEILEGTLAKLDSYSGHPDFSQFETIFKNVATELKEERGPLFSTRPATNNSPQGLLRFVYGS